jgi:trk system potassium uptake protein TrkA
MLPEGASSEWTEPSGNLQLCKIPLHRDWYGEPISLIQANTSARVAFITRLGEGIIPLERTILQEGDVVHLFVPEKEIAAVTASLANPPEDRA